LIYTKVHLATKHFKNVWQANTVDAPNINKVKDILSRFNQQLSMLMKLNQQNFEDFLYLSVAK